MFRKRVKKNGRENALRTTSKTVKRDRKSISKSVDSDEVELEIKEVRPSRIKTKVNFEPDQISNKVSELSNYENDELSEENIEESRLDVENEINSEFDFDDSLMDDIIIKSKDEEINPNPENLIADAIEKLKGSTSSEALNTEVKEKVTEPLQLTADMARNNEKELIGSGYYMTEDQMSDDEIDELILALGSLKPEDVENLSPKMREVYNLYYMNGDKNSAVKKISKSMGRRSDNTESGYKDDIKNVEIVDNDAIIQSLLRNKIPDVKQFGKINTKPTINKIETYGISNDVDKNDKATEKEIIDMYDEDIARSAKNKPKIAKKSSLLRVLYEEDDVQSANIIDDTTILLKPYRVFVNNKPIYWNRNREIEIPNGALVQIDSGITFEIPQKFRVVADIQPFMAEELFLISLEKEKVINCNDELKGITFHFRATSETYISKSSEFCKCKIHKVYIEE
jgi:hypothetical protein